MINIYQRAFIKGFQKEAREWQHFLYGALPGAAIGGIYEALRNKEKGEESHYLRNMLIGGLLGGGANYLYPVIGETTPKKKQTPVTREQVPTTKKQVPTTKGKRTIKLPKDVRIIVTSPRGTSFDIPPSYYSFFIKGWSQKPTPDLLQYSPYLKSRYTSQGQHITDPKKQRVILEKMFDQYLTKVIRLEKPRMIKNYLKTLYNKDPALAITFEFLVDPQNISGYHQYPAQTRNILLDKYKNIIEFIQDTVNSMKQRSK